MNAVFLILPTRGGLRYRGKRPTAARSVSWSRDTGLHVELNNGVRLWSAACYGAELPKPGDDFADSLAISPAMTAEQYAKLREAAELCRPGCTETERAAARAAIVAIRPEESAYAKRNAEARRREILAETASRSAFDPAKPFRVYNRGPWGSACFDFAELDAARVYLRGQAERRAFVTSGAAPAGPHGDSTDPLQSFIVWADGSETLADLGWQAPADGGPLWTRPETPAEPDSGLIDPMGGLRGTGELVPETLAERAGLKVRTVAADNGPALAPAEPETVEVIDLTPTWEGMGATLQMLAENGNAEGRRTAWEQIRQALRLADERNRLAGDLARYESAELARNETAAALADSDVIAAYAMAGDGCQAPGAIVLRRMTGGGHAYAVHFRNDQDSMREGRPCYYSGDYTDSLAEAWETFGARCRRYDPTGTLGRPPVMDDREALAAELKRTRDALSHIATVLNETGALESIGPVGDMCRDEADNALETAWHVLTGEAPAPRFRFDYDRMSGTGILVRLADNATSLRYTGEDAERLRDMTPAELAAQAAGQEFSI